MSIISNLSKTLKLKYFIRRIPKEALVLEVGSGTMWLKEHMKSNGWKNYTGIDIKPPADIVGDLRNWKNLGLKENSFDYIIAFEVIEHADIIKECYDLLKKGGKLFLTTPYPPSDKFLEILERLNLNQKRTSSHCNLTYIGKISLFSKKNVFNIFFLSQWGILTK